MAGPTSVSAPPMTPAIDSGPGLVAHQDGEFVERAIDTVESRQALTRAGGARVKLRRSTAGPAHQGIVVEGMQRLANVQHHIVRGIDDVVDGPQARQAQAPLQPIGARRHRHPFDQAEDETRV